jgi:4-amino-4-deoxy-L-arabinose transferase-like glycosyltransferase
MTLALSIKTRLESVSSQTQRLAQIVVVLLVLATVLVMVSHLVFLTSYPQVFIDEPWNANVAWTWLKTGVNFDTMHSGVLDQFGYGWVRWPYIGNVFWTISFALLGMGLFQIRLVSWIFACVLLLLVFLVGRRSYGSVSGALAAFLLSISPPFIQASHFARHDIILATLIMAVFLLLQIAFDKEKLWAHLLAGVLIGISPDVHPNGVFFIVGFGVLYLAVYRLQIFRKRGAWAFGIGALIGVGYYVAGHILPSPEAYAAVNKFWSQGSHQLPLFNPIRLLESIVQEIGRYHFFDNGLDFALVGASAVYLIVRRQKADRHLLVFVGASLACFVLFVGNKNDVYAILFYPFFMLMVAEALRSLVASAAQSTAVRVFMLTVLLLFVVNSTIHYLRPAISSRTYNYYAVTDQIRQVIPEGARVLGLPHWYLGLADYDYRSSLGLTYYHIYNKYSLTEGLEAIRPDYVIVDSALQGLLVDEGYFPPGPAFEIYKLPKQELQTFMAERGTKVEEFTNPTHGTFEVYKIRWDE